MHNDEIISMPLLHRSPTRFHQSPCPKMAFAIFVIILYLRAFRE